MDGRIPRAALALSLLAGCYGRVDVEGDELPGAEPIADAGSQATADAAAVCLTPCGLACCGPLELCNSASLRCEGACRPLCEGRACGSDGCGGVCGSCATGATCDESTGQCPGSCSPRCDERQCGPDGCGGSCGGCATGVCDQSGACVECLTDEDCLGHAVETHCDPDSTQCVRPAGPDAGTTDAGIPFPPDASTPPLRDAGVRQDAAAPPGPDAGPPPGPDAGSAPGSIHFAGSYTVAAREFPVYSASQVRVAALTYDAQSGGFVGAFGIPVAGGSVRTLAQTIRLNGASPVVGATRVVDTAVNAGESTLAPGIAAGKDASGSLLLTVFESDQLNIGRRRDIFGQLLRAEASGGLSAVGRNFAISTGNPASLWNPCVAFDEASGSFLVGWGDDRESAQRADGRVAFARTVSPSGALGSEVRLEGTDLWQDACSVSGGAGRFLIVWSDYLPAGGRALDIAYKARLLTAQGPVAPAFTLSRIGNVPPDPPAVAFNRRQGEWLVAFSERGGGAREIRAAIVRSDGSVRRTALLAGTHPEGAAAPYAAYSAATNSYLLTFHSMTTTDAFGQELTPDGDRMGGPVSLNNAPPVNGTYFMPIAASTTTGAFLTLLSQDWARIRGTLFVSPNRLP